MFMKVSNTVLNESIAFLIAQRNPTYLVSEIINLIQRIHKIDITADKVSTIEEECSELIEEYRKGGEKAIRKGIALGQLPYASLYERVKALGDIVKLAKDGYPDERITPRGEVITVTARNLQAATVALEAMHRCLEHMAEETTTDDWNSMVASFDPVSQKILQVYSPTKN